MTRWGFIAITARNREFFSLGSGYSLRCRENPDISAGVPVVLGAPAAVCNM